MAGKSNFIVRGGADFSSLKKEFQKVQSTMANFKKNIQSGMKNAVSGGVGKVIGATKSAFNGLKTLAGNIGRTILSAFDVGSLRDFIQESRAAYSETVQYEQKLATVMKARMGVNNKAVQGMLDFMSAEQELGVISADTMAAGAQELASYLESANGLKTLIPTLNNIATQQYGVDVSATQLQQTATMLGKVMDGQLGGLSRWGYSWTEAEEKILKTGTEMERAAVIAKVVKNSIGDMNYALAQTDIGRQKQLANTFDDIKAQAGAAFNQIAILFLPALRVVADTLAKIANIARQAAQLISQTFGGKQAQTQAAAQQKLAVSADAAADGEKELGNSVEKTNKQMKKSLAGFDELEKLQSNIEESAEEAADEYGAAGDLFQGGIQAPVEIDPKVEETFKKIKDIFKGTFNWGDIQSKAKEGTAKFAEILNKGISAIDLGNIGNIVGQAINTALVSVHTFLTTFNFENLGKTLADGINGIFKSLSPQTAGATIAEFFNSVANFVYGSVKNIDWGGIGQWFADAVNKLFTDFNWERWGQTVSTLIRGIFKTFIDFIQKIDWGELGRSIGTAIINIDWLGILTDVLKAIGGIAIGAVQGIGGIISGLFGNNQRASASPPAASVSGSNGVSGGSFGRNMPVPRLAAGATIPPNRPFAAILGDQTSGVNIEAPESTLRAIYAEEMETTNSLLEELIMAVRDGKILMVDKTVLGRTVTQEQERQNRSMGR